MKAVRFHQFGGPEVLRYEDVEQPTPGAGQVRIRVAATSFNSVDADIRAGSRPVSIPVRLPHTPGIDVTGTVDALGADVDDVSVGDRVVGFLPMTSAGAAAEYVIAPAEALTGAPRHRPLSDLAALPLVGLTAWQSLFDHGNLAAGQRVLISGAGGAVGGYAVQLAEEARAQVVVLAGPGSRRWVGSAGAGEVIHPYLADATEPVDLVLNFAPLAPEQLRGLLALVRDGGRLVSTTVWTPAPSDEKRGVHGIDMFVRSDIDQLADLVARVSTGELLLDVTRRLALADLPAFHAQVDTTALSGKVVVLAPPA